MTTAARWPERQADLFLAWPNHPGPYDIGAAPETCIVPEPVKPTSLQIRDRVYREIRRLPGTTHQIAMRTGLAYEAVQPRTSELHDARLIRDSGRRGPSRCPTRTAIVWEIIPLG